MLAAIRFLTILPVPGRWGTGTDDLAGSVPCFPLVGLLLGGMAGAVAWGLPLVAPPPVAALLVVLALAVFSGCLHLDGLSDTADGLLSSRPRDEMLEIMKDSHVGVMGVIALVAVLLLKFAALSSIPAGDWWPVVFLMPLAGRAAIVVHVALLPCARPDGLAAIFFRRRQGLAAVWAAAILAAVAWVLLEGRGLAVWCASIGVALLLAGYFYRKIGGATGDTLGAVCELVETIPALTLAAWPIQSGR
jgi:adenosylcobinamide-GDP ribazoletransferase